MILGLSLFHFRSNRKILQQIDDNLIEHQLTTKYRFLNQPLTADYFS